VNKKVKNATLTEVGDIQFKSKLEATVYKALKEEGFEPEYEKKRYVLQESEMFSIPCYMPYKDRKTHREEWGLNKYKTLSIKYTPDFTFMLGDKLIVIEVKGMQNDRYPYQKKLFLKWLSDNNENACFFEIHNQKQLKKAIEILKEWKVLET
jgi:hypothetical protein